MRTVDEIVKVGLVAGIFLFFSRINLNKIKRAPAAAFQLSGFGAPYEAHLL